MKIKLSRIAALLLSVAVFAVPACTDYSQDLKEIKADIASLKSGDIATLQGQVAALQSATSALQESAKQFTTDISALKADTQTLKAADQKLSSDIQAVNSALEAYKVKVSGDFTAAAAAAQKALTDAVAGLNSQISEINTKVATVEVEYKAADAQLLAGYTSADEALKTLIQGVATSSSEALAALAVKVQANTTAINTINTTSIPALQQADAEITAAYTKAIAELDAAYKAADAKNLAEAKESIAAVKSELNDKITEAKTALQAGIDKLTADLAQTRTDFSTALENYKVQAAASLQAAVDNLQAKLDKLESDYQKADEAQKEALSKDIKTVSDNLAAAKKELSEALAVHKTEAAIALNTAVVSLQEKLDKLEKDYKAADVELSAAIKAGDAALASQLSAQKTELLSQIEKVSTDLKNTSEDLYDTIEENQVASQLALATAIKDIEAKLVVLKADYVAADKVVADAAAAADALLLKGYEAADNALKADIAALDAKLTGNISELQASVTTQIAALKAELSKDIADVSAALVAYKAEVAGVTASLNERVTILEEKVGTIQTTLGELDTRISASVKAIDATNTDLAAFKQLTNDNFAAINKTIEVLAANIDENSDEIDAIKNRLNDYVLTTVLDQKVKELRAEIALKLDIADFNAQKAVIEGNIEAVLNGYKEADAAIIAAYKKADEEIVAASKAADEALDKKISGLDAKTTASIVALKSEINTKITELQEKAHAAFEQYKAEVKGQIDELNTKVSDLQTACEAFDAQIDALQKATAKLSDELNKAVTMIGLRIDGVEEDVFENSALIAGNTVAIVINTGAIAALNEALEDLGEELNKSIEALREDLQGQIDELNELVKGQGSFIGGLAEKVGELEGNVDELLGRIQSLVFVPDYNDGKATLNFVQSDSIVYPAYSQLVYKVYPKECVEALTASNISFEVVAVQTRMRTRGDDEPTLQVVNVRKHPQTDGAVIVTVVPQNMTDMVPAKKVAPTQEEKPVPAQSYSFCLKVQNEDTGDERTSEFTNAVASNLHVWLDPYYGFVKNEGTLEEEIEYIPYHGIETQKPYTCTDDIDITQGITPFFTSGNEVDGYKHFTAAFIKKFFGVDLTVTQMYVRSYAILPNHDVEIEDYDKARILTEAAADTIMLFKNYADAIGLYNPKTPVMGGLSDANEPNVRRQAIRVLEKVQLVAATPTQDISKGQGARADCYFRVTKEHQIVHFDDINVNWTWDPDVKGDAYLFENPDGKYQYYHDTIAVNFNAADVEALNAKGVTYADFYKKTEKQSRIVDNYGFMGPIYVKGTINPAFFKPQFDNSGCNVSKITLDPKTGKVRFNAAFFNWDRHYVMWALYEFDYIDVEVVGVMNTYDRKRTPVTYTYSDTSFVYTKNIVKEDAFGATATKADPGIKVPMFNTIAALGYFPATVETKAFDADYFNGLVFDNGLRKDASDHAYMYPSAKDRAVCNYKLTYKDGLKPIKCWYTFYTWYGQQITFEKNVKFTAPAYDFKHNSYFVSQDTDGKYFSQVNPKWDPSQTVLEKFDVETVDPNAAFSIVDGDDNIVVKQTKPQTTLWDETTGLAASFAFRTTPQSDSIKMNYKNYCIKYKGYDETVPVYGMLFIVSHKGTADEFRCQIPNTRFKVGNDYGTYYVKKFNPLPKENFKTTQDVEQKVMSSMTYTFNPFQYLSLMDYRGVSDETGIGTVSYECIDKNNGYWILGTEANGFKSTVRANDAYVLKSSVTYTLDGAPEEVKNYVKLDPSTMKVVFDYNQKLTLTQSFTIKIKVKLDNSFEKPDTMVAEVNVKIVPVK